MTRRTRRLTLIAVAGAVLAVAAGLILFALSDRIVFFSVPADVAAHKIAVGQRLRLGGMVAAGSLQKGADGNVTFDVTDNTATVRVAYQGILPDLFREGQGVVTEGILQPDGSLAADTVLAKHDERYMPRELVEALKRQGRWQETADTVRQAPDGTTR